MWRGKGDFRSLLLCVALAFGSMAGVPMRPDEIQRLMRTLATGASVQTAPEEKEDGEPIGDDAS
jgi:hypothetical protein